MKTVYTIGYQGVTLEEFILRLKDERIKAIVDVRANPVSRKPGFSKKALSGRLAAEGIDYHHFPSLGILSRHRKVITDLDALFYIYATDLILNHDETVAQVAAICQASRSALLCFEANPKESHRHVLALYIRHTHHTITRHIRF